MKMQRVIILIGILLALLILYVPLSIFALTITGADASSPEGLLTLNTKDSTRLAESNPAALSLALARALFPDGTGAAPDGVVVVTGNDWRTTVAAAPLVRWVNGPLLTKDATNAAESEIVRLKPRGVSALGGATTITVGLDQPGGATNQTVGGANPAELAANVDDLVSRVAGNVPRNVLLVPEDPAYAIPAAYWAAQFGDVVLFSGNPLPDATRRALERRNGQARIYAIGLDGNAQDLARYGAVQTIQARDGVSAAVAVAKFYDSVNNVGWGMDESRYDSGHNFVLANREHPELAAAGLALARFGKFGPLLWVERDSIPAATEQYLWKMKPEFFKTPAEGPFNHLWLLGAPDVISIQVQGAADVSQEIDAYRFEESGLSGMEAIWVVWIVAGAACGLWLLLHSWRRIPQMTRMMRVSWVLLGLVLGPIAVWLYRQSYHRTEWMKHGEMTMWHRQGFAPTLAASAMNRGFDGPLMLIISWIVTALGLPLLVYRGPFFWLGNSMVTAIFIAYFAALALHWLVMHAGMFMSHEKLSCGQAVRRAFVPAFLSMTAMAMGMMGFMFWIQMVNLMMEGMPEDDEIMWWGTTLVAIVVGLLVALPVDAWLVRHQKQPGTM